jgi:hypothetical protein
MMEFTEAQKEGLAVAHRMVDAGIPVFVAAGNHSDTGSEFLYPKAWESTRPNHDVVDRWRPGMALCAVMGVLADVWIPTPATVGWNPAPTSWPPECGRGCTGS